MTERGIHGKAVTCTECRAVVPVDLPENANVPEFFMPRFDTTVGDFVHPDGSRCTFHDEAAR